MTAKTSSEGTRRSTPDSGRTDQVSAARKRVPIAYPAIALTVVVFVGFGIAAIFWSNDDGDTTVNTRARIADTIPTEEPGEATLQALIVLDGAKQVSRDPGAYGSFHVSYELAEDYPASGAIQQISSTLKARGWKPLRIDWLNPGLPSSHVRGWTDYIDSGNPPYHVHQWSGQWQDESGNIADYVFWYRYPADGKPNLRTLWISGGWTPSASVKILQTPTAQEAAE